MRRWLYLLSSFMLLALASEMHADVVVRARKEATLEGSPSNVVFSAGGHTRIINKTTLDIVWYASGLTVVANIATDIEINDILQLGENRLLLVGKNLSDEKATMQIWHIPAPVLKNPKLGYISNNIEQGAERLQRLDAIVAQTGNIIHILPMLVNDANDPIDPPLPELGVRRILALSQPPNAYLWMIDLSNATAEPIAAASESTSSLPTIPQLLRWYAEFGDASIGRKGLTHGFTYYLIYNIFGHGDCAIALFDYAGKGHIDTHQLISVDATYNDSTGTTSYKPLEQLNAECE